NLAREIELGFSVLHYVLANYQYRNKEGYSYSRQPDGSRCNVKIHEIVHDTALEIVANAVDDDLLSDVDKLHICKILLGNRFVNLLIVANSVHKVLSRVFRI